MESSAVSSDSDRESKNQGRKTDGESKHEESNSDPELAGRTRLRKTKAERDADAARRYGHGPTAPKEPDPGTLKPLRPLHYRGLSSAKGEPRAPSASRPTPRIPVGGPSGHVPGSFPLPLSFIVGSGGRIPEGFIRPNAKTRWQDSDIREGTYLRCLAAQVFTPTRFFVNVYENWHYLELFMQRLQVWVKGQLLSIHHQNRDTMASWACLRPGLYVLFQFPNVTTGDIEWHRAVVLRKDPADKSTVMVELIDYGDEVKARVTDLRYMLRAMLEDFPAQAVRCRLAFGYPVDDCQDTSVFSWPKEAVDKMYDMVNGKFLGVYFHRRLSYGSTGINFGNRGIWLVSINVIVGDRLRKPFDLIEVMKNETSSVEKPKSEHEERRLKALKQIDPTLVKHPDGSFATAVAIENISNRLGQYIDRSQIENYIAPDEKTNAGNK